MNMVVMTAKLTILRALQECHVGRANKTAPKTCRLQMRKLKVLPKQGP